MFESRGFESAGLGKIEVEGVYNIAEHILYADADVVHLANVSTRIASEIYEILKDAYGHFIHVPHETKGLCIASKYPLGQAEIIVGEKENLEFVIQGTNSCYARANADDLSIEIIRSNDAYETITSWVLVGDLPASLTIVQHPTSLALHQTPSLGLLSAETFYILPIKHHRDRDRNEGGHSVEADVSYNFGGKDGGNWDAGVRGEIHDSHGNYAEAEVRSNDKGEGSVSARAGHKSD